MWDFFKWVNFIALLYWDTYILSTVRLWLLGNDERVSDEFLNACEWQI